MFADVPGYDYMMQLVPWALVGTVVGLILIVVAKIMGKSVARKSREPFIGMTVQDIDRMRREGVISEEEYKRIRHKAAERELELMRQKSEADAERLILSEVALNPDAARKLIKPDQRAEAKPIAKQQPVAAPHPAPTQEDSSKLDFDEFDWGDPLRGDATHVAQPPSAVNAVSDKPDMSISHPQPGKIRVPPPQVVPQKEEPAGELEILLQKGAITREDYERFKAMMKK